MSAAYLQAPQVPRSKRRQGRVFENCDGKTPFVSPTLATTVAQRVPGLMIHRCSVCGCWHVGNAKFGNPHSAQEK